MINTSDFIATMEAHWVSTLGNTTSPNLRTAWGQISDAFNKHIAAHDNPKAKSKWTVLSPPTGSGKSQGTAVYCSMLANLPEETRPGVLIVTRLKADANTMAETINKLAGRPVATPFHTDTSDVLISDLWCWDVVVITHKAYELALDKLGSHGQIQQTWDFFHNHGQHAKRKLVVIDESLDIVEESQGNLEGLRQTLAAIPQKLREKHKDATEGLAAVVALLEQMTTISEATSTKEAVLLSGVVSEGTPPDYTELRRDLKEVRFDQQLHRNDLEENKRLHQMHDKRLKQLDTIFRSWNWYAKLGDRGHTLNTARLLVPENSKGAVVLDATALHDVIYELFDKVELISPPSGVRDYSNVTLWVSKGHKQGKVYMRNHAKQLTESLMGELSTQLTRGNKVFTCCHKDVEPVLRAYQPEFQHHVGHWGAVDGSNEWKDCDTAVIFGLPYLPDTWSANAYFALQGVKTTEWLQSDNRPHGRHKDVREALRTGHIVSSVVQAINRIRCRKVIDAKGNCPESNVYLMLPNGYQGEAILKGILESMPNVQLRDWTFDGAKRKTKRGNYEEALLTFAGNMSFGRASATNIRQDLGIPSSSWKRLIGDLNDSDTSLSKSLVELGVVYQVQRSGKTQRGYLIKT